MQLDIFPTKLDIFLYNTHKCVVPMCKSGVCVCVSMKIDIFWCIMHNSACITYRVAKTHRMPYLKRLFSAKEPYD